MAGPNKFKRRPRDFYPTPPKAVDALLRVLPPATRFIEPAAGDGSLLRVLEAAGHRCEWAYDIEPQAATIERRDAFAVGEAFGLTIITNPPFSIINDLLRHWLIAGASSIWVLAAHSLIANLNTQALMKHCDTISPIGRVKWFPESRYSSTDDFAWFRFTQNHQSEWTRLVERTSSGQTQPQ